MKKYRIIFKVVSFAILFATVSCTKFLEKTSPDITIPTTVQHFEELLYGEAYPNAQTGLLEVLSDNTKLSYISIDERDMRSLPFIPSFLWEKDMEQWQPGVLTGIWRNLYQSISVCNLVIEGLNDIETSVERDHVLGQAHVLRAHHYFLLNNIYGEPFRKGKENKFGVAIKTNALAEDKKYKRNTVDEVYNLIENDLELGLSLMKKESSRLNGEINYLSALTLASRVALFVEDYDQVISYGNEYLKHNVPLLNPEGSMTKGNFISLQNEEITMLFGGSYNEMTGVYLTTSPTARTSLWVADEVFDLFDKDLASGEVDMRPNWFFETSSRGVTYPKKSSTIKRHAYRAAEVYLNMAEAYFELDKPEDALKLLNQLRKARIKGYTNRALSDFNTATLESFIEEERRREFCFEDFRWFDMRRYNRTVVREFESPEGEFEITLEPNDWGYTMQVPLLEQNRNPLFEVIPRPERTPSPIN